MGRIIGIVLGAILAIWLAITAADGILATLKRFLIIGLIVVAVFIVVRLLAGRRAADDRPEASDAGRPADSDHET